MKKRYIMWILVIGIFVLVEIKPYKIYASSIFTSFNSTYVRLYVIVNSLLPIDEERMAENIVEHNRKINGPKEKVKYELHLYRTKIHYKHNIKTDTLICDENGNILK